MSSMIVVRLLFLFIPNLLPLAFFLFVILLYWIFNGTWHNAPWVKKKRIVTGVLLFITVLMVPISLFGAWDIVAINSGNLYVEDSGSVEISPERTYKSEILSNRLAVDYNVIIVFVPSLNPFTVYLCDENLPLEWHDEQNITTESMVYYIRLPYLYSGPFLIAKWTLNFYNPSQNESAHADFEILKSGILIDPRPPTADEALTECKMPIVTLYAFWFIAGTATALARRGMRKNLRRKEGNLQQVEDEQRIEL